MVSREIILYNLSKCWDDFYADTHRGTTPGAWTRCGEKLRSWWFDLMAANKLEEVFKSRKMLFYPSRIRVSVYALLFRLGVLQPASPHLTRDELAILALSGGVIKDIALTDDDAKVLEIRKARWRKKRGPLRGILHAISGGSLFGV